MARVGEYELVNEEKVQRVIEGQTNAQGEMVDGLGADAIENDPMAVIAAYDKLGGLIKGKEGAKVKTGSFYDFKKKAPRKEPEVVYVFRVNGEDVEMAEGAPLPLEVKAAKMADEVKAKRAAKK